MSLLQRPTSNPYAATQCSVRRYLQEILGQAEKVVDEINLKKKNADFHDQRLEATLKDGYIGKGDDWICKVLGEY